MAFASLLGALSGGCKADGELTVTALGLGEALAVDAYHPLTVSDACRANPKISICRTEDVVSIDEATSSDEHIVVAVPADEMPAEFEAEPGTWFLRGKDGGVATISVTATFDDDSVRSGEMEVTVQSPTRVTVADFCPTALVGSEIPLLVQLVGMQMFNVNQELRGLVPGALVGDGLTQDFGTLTETRYTFRAPPEPGEVRIRSVMLPKLDKTFVVFNPLDVTDIAIDRDSSEPFLERRGATPIFDLALKVGDEPICRPVPVAVAALTPEVCVGRNGELTWSEALAHLRLQLVETGTCRLSLVPVGAERAFEIDFEYEATE